MTNEAMMAEKIIGSDCNCDELTDTCFWCDCRNQIIDAIKLAEARGRNEFNRRFYPTFALEPDRLEVGSAYDMTLHKEKINCPFCKKEVYVMRSPSNFDDYDLGRRQVSYARNQGLRRATQIILNQKTEIHPGIPGNEYAFNHNKTCDAVANAILKELVE